MIRRSRWWINNCFHINEDECKCTRYIVWKHRWWLIFNPRRGSEKEKEAKEEEKQNSPINISSNKANRNRVKNGTSGHFSLKCCKWLNQLHWKRKVGDQREEGMMSIFSQRERFIHWSKWELWLSLDHWNFRT